MNSVGMWLIKSQTVGSAVSSVTVSSAFSTDYDNYKILYTGGTHSAAQDIGLQLGSTTTGYYGARIALFYTSDTFNYARNNNSASFGFVGTGSTVGAYCNFELLNPFTSTRTIVNAPTIGNTSSAAVAGTYNGFLDNSNSYTAFTLIPTGGTLTGGTISVYGYRKA
jgi:hypothetical protein